MNVLLAFILAFAMTLKVPFDKINHPSDDVVNRMQNNVERALQKVSGTTLDHWNDGTLFKRVLGVDSTNRVTSSGIAPYTIVASNVSSGALTNATMASGTLQGSALAAGSVDFDRMAPAGQFSVYRTGAFNCGPNAFSAFIGDTVLKDLNGGFNPSNGVYTIPANGDWQFQWAIGLAMTNTAKNVTSSLVLNSGNNVFGSEYWTAAATSNYTTVGSFLYCGARAGEKVALRIFNGDSVTSPLLTTSGTNYFQGYRIR